MCPGLDLLTDELERLSHGVSVAPGHDPPVALGRADGAEEICPFGPLIVRRAGPRPPPRPASRAFVLLTHPGVVLNPELYRLAATLGADAVDDVADVLLNASMASSCCGRAARLATPIATPKARRSRPGSPAGPRRNRPKPPQISKGLSCTAANAKSLIRKALAHSFQNHFPHPQHCVLPQNQLTSCCHGKPPLFSMLKHAEHRLGTPLGESESVSRSISGALSTNRRGLLFFAGWADA